MPDACHYDVLDVEATADNSQITKAYYKKSKEYHPDKNKNEGSTAIFQRISEAYQTLKDPKKRATYDASKILKPIFQTIGLPVDERPIQWAATKLQETAGARLEVQYIDRRMVEHLNTNLPNLSQRSSAQFYQFHTHTQGVVLITGVQHNIEIAKQIMKEYIDELSGNRPPNDGLVFKLPRDMAMNMTNMQIIQSQTNNFQNLMWTTGAAIHAVNSERIIARGGSRLVQVVQHLQSYVDYRGTVLLRDQPEMDAWQYAHAFELTGQQGNLVPPKEPDTATVRRLQSYALTCKNVSFQQTCSLMDLAARCLKLDHLTVVLIRVITSSAVHTDFQRLSSANKGPFLAALASLEGAQAEAIQTRFTTDPGFLTLKKLGPFLDSNEGLVLRSKGHIAAKQSVADDASWHSWQEVLGNDSRLGLFWRDLRKFLTEKNRPTLPAPPAEWHTIPEVMQLVLRSCVGPGLDISAAGLRRQPDPEPVPAPPNRVEVVEVVSLPTTVVEDAEDVIYERQQRDGSPSVQMGQVTHAVQQLGHTNERLSKSWYEQHVLSFVVERVERAGDWWVSLCATGQKRAALRWRERERERERQEVEEVAKSVLARMESGSSGLPGSLNDAEACGMLVLLPERRGLAGSILQRLASVPAPDLPAAMAPFTTAQVMRAIVQYQKDASGRDEAFAHDGLAALVNAATFNMRDLQGTKGTGVPLHVVKDSLLAATHKPFLSLYKERAKLACAAAIRISMDLIASSDGKEPINTCPVPLSPSYSCFKAFAELCGVLAHLYYMLSSSSSSSLERELKDGLDQAVTQAFSCLATMLESYWEHLDAKEPRPLCRLAYAFAQIGRETREDSRDASLLGLRQISKVLAVAQLKDWDMAQLAEIATSFRQLPEDEVFDKLAEAASRASGMKREPVLHLIGAFKQADVQGKMRKFLEKLKEAGWFKKNVDAPEKELVNLLAGMLAGEDFEAVEELVKHLKDRSVSNVHMASLVKELDATEAASLKPVKQGLMKMALDKMTRNARVSFKDLEKLLDVQDERCLQLLRDLCSSRPGLDAISRAGGSLSHCFQRLAPLARERAPRLEAGCAARMLQSLELNVFGSSDSSTSKLQKEVVAQGREFSQGALASMPVLVQAIARALGKLEEPRDESWEQLVQTMLRAVQVGRASECTGKFDTWVLEVEDLILKEGSSEEKFDRIERHLLHNKEQNTRIQEIKDSLGENWLGVLLVRSRRLSWTGKVIQMQPPRPQASLRELAPKCGARLREELQKLPAEARKRPAPASPSRPSRPSPKRPAEAEPAEPQAEPKRQKAKAKPDNLAACLSVYNCDDPNWARALEGDYRRYGTHCGKASYRKIAEDETNSVQGVVLHYCDDPQDLGWWFSPDIDSPVAWLHNRRTNSFPPEEGWEFGLRVVPKLRAPGAAPKRKTEVKAKARPRPGQAPAAAAPAAAAPAAAAPAAAAPAAAAPAAAAPATAPARAAPPELSAWLRSLHPSKPETLLCYMEKLNSEFDGDLSQIALARIDNDPEKPVLARVEPRFWEAIDCTTPVHKMLLAKGIMQLEG